jgi:hypothetical protein
MSPDLADPRLAQEIPEFLSCLAYSRAMHEKFRDGDIARKARALVGLPAG